MPALNISFFPVLLNREAQVRELRVDPVTTASSSVMSCDLAFQFPELLYRLRTRVAVKVPTTERNL
jgi:hypothetical protein